MRNCKRSDDRHERAQTAEGNHQAAQKQQVVRAAEDVKEPEVDESQRCLVPARIQTHETRVALELEGARRSLWRKKAQRRDNSLSESVEARVNRKLRPIRLHGVFQEDVE